MPEKWPEDVYNYTTNTVVHEDIASLDLEDGKFFKCKFCKNPRDAENKFCCRTPFSAVQITGKSGHMESKTHKENKDAAQKKPQLKAFVAKHLPNANNPLDPNTSAAPAEGGPQLEGVMEEKPTPKAKPVCCGVCWDITEPKGNWQDYCKSYQYFVDGAEEQSGKFYVELQQGRYLVKAIGCTGEGLPGWQHRIKCCKPCHLMRTDSSHVVKNSLQLMDKILYASTLIGKAVLTKSDTTFLQHVIIDRSNSLGNTAFRRMKDAARVRECVWNMSNR